MKLLNVYFLFMFNFFIRYGTGTVVQMKVRTYQLLKNYGTVPVQYSTFIYFHNNIFLACARFFFFFLSLLRYRSTFLENRGAVAYRYCTGQYRLIVLYCYGIVRYSQIFLKQVSRVRLYS